MSGFPFQTVAGSQSHPRNDPSLRVIFLLGFVLGLTLGVLFTFNLFVYMADFVGERTIQWI